MVKIYSETDDDVCHGLWDRFIPHEQLTDLWDVRACFHQYYKRPLFFVVAKEGVEVIGLIPLCFIEEHRYYGYFPGEIWDGKTWLEQNHLMARDEGVLRQMLHWLLEEKVPCYLRYLHRGPYDIPDLIGEDEIGYLFHPETFHFDMEEYYATFSKKTIKKLRREVNRMYERELSIRNGNINDFEEMVTLNIERFGSRSYFANNQFVKSFRALRDYLEEKCWLQMTTVLIGKQVAAVDMGCVYNGIYTLLSGATHDDYPGIAKVINLYHMEEGCRKKYRQVDFLCGDFFWKKLFHLTPRPLYKVSNMKA